MSGMSGQTGGNNPMTVEPLVAARCDSCGGILAVAQHGELNCKYCGSVFFLHNTYKGNQDKVHNFWELANLAQETGDPASADKYFTKILEEDRSQVLAWYGKGVVLLAMSTTAKVNSREASSYFRQAMKYASAAETTSLREAIRDSCHYYTLALVPRIFRSGGAGSEQEKLAFGLLEFGEQFSPYSLDQMIETVRMLSSLHADRYARTIGKLRRQIAEEKRKLAPPGRSGRGGPRRGTRSEGFFDRDGLVLVLLLVLVVGGGAIFVGALFFVLMLMASM